MGDALFNAYCREIETALDAADPLNALDTLYRSSLHRARERDALFAAMSFALAAETPVAEAAIIPHLGTVG